MLRKLFKRNKSSDTKISQRIVVEDGSLIHMAGRTIQKSVLPEIGATILELAEKYDVDWNSNCRRGTCARCRCFVQEGMEFLSEPNEAEINRLEKTEIVEGYRLGCQAEIKQAGNIHVRHASYF